MADGKTKPAKKFGTHPVKIWPISELFTDGRRTVLFNVINPNNAAKISRFPRAILSFFLLSKTTPSGIHLV